MKKIIVLGGGGFIGGHLAKKLHESGNDVTVVDLSKHDYFKDSEICNNFIAGDLRDFKFVLHLLVKGYDEIYQLASDVGGSAYITTGTNDAYILSNSARINLNVASVSAKLISGKVFFSSSSCAYPVPDGDYGFEKLFSERLYSSFHRNCNLDIRIGRYQNVYGSFDRILTNKERVVIALCRKVIKAKDGDSIEVWGDGTQLRHFIHVDDCVDATIKIMRGDITSPVNIGSFTPTSINDLAKIIIKASGKDIGIMNIFGNEFKKKYGFNCPVGVMDKEFIEGHGAIKPLDEGILSTYEWVKKELHEN